MSFFNRGTPSDDETDPPPSDEVAIERQPPEEDKAPPPDRTFDTALGAGSVIEGSLSSDGNVRLDGQFKGTLDIQENVLIGITAEIEADVDAKNISIAGQVRGNVTGRKVHLLATAQVWGDIFAHTLITEDGAFIEGHVSMTKARNGESKQLPAAVDDKRQGR